MSIRTPVLAGNWKMNKGPQEAAAFFSEFLGAHEAREDRTIIFFPPALSLAAAADALAARPDIGLGVQNIHWEAAGAFTGEISALMAAQAGAAYVLAGHSERRHVFGESDTEVGRKTAAALAAGLTPVVCVGEQLEERRSGRLQEVLLRQLDAILDPVGEEDAHRLIVAYEPVWAIGTGVNATPQDASAAHAVLRRRLAERFGTVGQTVPILYGGSVKSDNCVDLLAADGVDGLLVGGASMDPGGFATIANA